MPNDRNRHMPGSPNRLLVCMLALIAGLAAGSACAATADELFQQGVEAARADDYERAIEAFEAARRAGLDTGALHYNLGTAYYGAGNMDGARRAFRRAWRSKAMRAPAAYMLGRLARRRGDTAGARTWFQRAHDAAQTPALRRRAANGLEDVVGDTVGGFGYLALGTAHDSNVTAAPADLDGTSDASDSALRLVLAMREPLGRRLYATGSLYTERFSDLSRFDYTAVRGGAGWRNTVRGPWQWQVEAQARHERLGGDPLRNSVILDAAVDRRPPARRRVRIAYELTRYRAATEYDFLDGRRQRIEVASKPWSGSGWLGTVALERMNRRDLDTGSDFQSFSWSAGEAELGYHFAFGSHLDLEVGGDLAHRDYDGTEVRNAARVGSRQDDIAGVYVEATGAVGAGFSWRLRLRHEERRSNIDEFDYERDRVVAYLERLF